MLAKGRRANAAPRFLGAFAVRWVCRQASPQARGFRGRERRLPIT
jgi:hypothetical protein